MEDNKFDNTNSSPDKPKSSPFLSERGQFNPNLKQNNVANQPNTGQQHIPNPAQPVYNQPNPVPPFASSPYQQQPMQNGKLKHSGLGISSFIIAIVSVLLGITFFILSIVGVTNIVSDAGTDLSSLSDPNQLNDMLLSDNMGSGFGIIIVASLLFMVSGGLAFIGGILGLIAVFQKNRKKVFSILGLIFNVFIVLGFLLLFVIGIATGL